MLPVAHSIPGPTSLAGDAAGAAYNLVFFNMWLRATSRAGLSMLPAARLKRGVGLP